MWNVDYCLESLTRKLFGRHELLKMLRRLCTCCFANENSDNERQPLLQPWTPELNGSESARLTRPVHSDVQHTGRLVMRRVCVPELDLRFSDVAETFNELQERYETMVRHIRNLQNNCGCTHDALTISECVGMIREEHRDKYKISLRMKGYDFSLSVDSDGADNKTVVPPDLRLAQGELKCTSENIKAAISKGTILHELIGWLLRSKVKIAEQVKRVAETYLEEGRLNENLEKNMKEVERAKELSVKYRQHAEEVLTEAAQIAGAPL